MDKKSYIKRNITDKFERALKISPVVLLTGARQTGKTTLIKHLYEKQNCSYITFDDFKNISAVTSDPETFFSGRKTPIILDEIQRVPKVFLTIKKIVDENRKPGIFILTGSANPLLLPKVSDSLAGRMFIINLYPFSQGEIKKKKEIFLETIFSNKIFKLKLKKESTNLLLKKLVTGGYPPVQDYNDEDLYGWFSSYLTTILQRDVQDLAKIEGLAQLPNLLELISARTGSLLNTSELSRSSKLANTSLQRYITLLQTLFIVFSLKPWHKNLGKRLVKSPKIYLCDSGLLLHLLKADKEKLNSDPNLLGKVLENFVVTELLKQCSWSKSNVDMYHYRTATGSEVDVILEDRSGNIVGIEIKSSKMVIADDFKGLKQFQSENKKSFVNGIVLYNGDEIIPFGKNLFAMPMNSLWL